MVTIGGSWRINKTVALALIYENRERVLMQLRDFKDWISCPGKWGFFGGSLKHEESPDLAIVRELQEELDFAARAPLYFRDYYYKEEYALIHVYSCLVDLTPESLKLNEGQELGIFSLEEILKGRLFSKKLQSDYPVVDISSRILNDFFR
ncbi:MAG: hypothetical protein A3J81_06230 [Nitrospirae bacterium RIFOXYB2_FULL_43_5]|nr:MAG: hypothetical protein A2X54_09465 [Nitrospirae bacterium GWF2_44_13]OGW32597.1 MAG: hypothetical protein A2088_02385 [Nitrospirae bacterium GWD2_44_7]OGW63543.1 MAG: hypothetical protein A2222_06755 [Nitrospirae bacterium RIFOXYA2_FULL_44_9]OGW73894.1 MAG: hypothetical protein A3J81_06230 [Nitrospirae bacterium RIFOXYB2_FULL_43_5]OGW74191.1 MAG: hypothetical protein A2484_07595 [Nitrospirae bacterium RIFOXYC2_FULL_44_7]